MGRTSYAKPKLFQSAALQSAVVVDQLSTTSSSFDYLQLAKFIPIHPIRRYSLDIAIIHPPTGLDTLALPRSPWGTFPQTPGYGHGHGHGIFSPTTPDDLPPTPQSWAIGERCFYWRLAAHVFLGLYFQGMLTLSVPPWPSHRRISSRFTTCLAKLSFWVIERSVIYSAEDSNNVTHAEESRVQETKPNDNDNDDDNDDPLIRLTKQ
ncbi:hypothetical protein ACRALDRAFT_207589 [Sodiomyces alcalophilus JCM 7366]|uniref:uncharacterized protein n=1 Tax=Sodiomyces alcalophilus JCM 7366 TaxID=591952 RepID=UPI0039B67591